MKPKTADGCAEHLSQCKADEGALLEVMRKRIKQTVVVLGFTEY